MEGRLAGEHLIEDAAQRVQVRPPVHLGGGHLLPLLRRGIVGRQHDSMRDALPGDALGRHGRNAEVENLGLLAPLARSGHQDVLRLHVAMHDALGVRRSQTGTDATEQIQSPGNLQPARRLIQHRAQARAFHILHGDKEAAILGLVQIGDLDHVGMAQLVGGARLLAKALDELRVLAQIGGEKLERHLTAQQNMFGQINHAHSALAQLARNAIFSPHQRARRQFV